MSLCSPLSAVPRKLSDWLTGGFLFWSSGRASYSLWEQSRALVTEMYSAFHQRLSKTEFIPSALICLDSLRLCQAIRFIKVYLLPGQFSPFSFIFQGRFIQHSDVSTVWPGVWAHCQLFMQRAHKVNVQDGHLTWDNWILPFEQVTWWVLVFLLLQTQLISGIWFFY